MAERSTSYARLPVSTPTPTIATWSKCKGLGYLCQLYRKSRNCRHSSSTSSKLKLPDSSECGYFGSPGRECCSKVIVLSSTESAGEKVVGRRGLVIGGLALEGVQPNYWLVTRTASPHLMTPVKASYLLTCTILWHNMDFRFHIRIASRCLSQVKRSSTRHSSGVASWIRFSLPIHAMAAKLYSSSHPHPCR